VAAASGATAAPAVSSPSPAFSAWQFGFRAGWSKDWFSGSTKNVSILGDPALMTRVQGSRSWNYGQNYVDLGLDFQTPEYWSNISIFTTLGGGPSVGTTGREGALVGRQGFSTVVAASIQDDGLFYMHIGPSFRIDLPWAKQYFDLRPYTGFDVHWFTGKLVADDRNLVNPNTGAAGGLSERQTNQSRVFPLLGIETVFHLDCPIFSVCEPHPYGLDAYVGYDHSFNTGGQKQINGTTQRGVQYSGQYNPGDVDRIAAGFQFHFNAPWQ